jgi:hypothetical protein
VRQFASSGFRIWNLGREAKLVYTGFGVFALMAILVSVLFYEDLVGPKTAGVRGYYAGDTAAKEKEAAAPAGGPHIELPPDAPQPITVPVTYRKLLEVTHFHLFTLPVFLLIIAHLFMLTGLSTRWKTWWIAGGWVSSFLHLLSPWLIHYGSASLSVLYPISGALMALTLSVMTAYPIMVMWGHPPEK